MPLSSGRLRAALERIDFPAGREKFLFQRDHFGAVARGQLTLLISQDFRGLPCLLRRRQCTPSLLTLSSGLLRAALERIDFPRAARSSCSSATTLALLRVASSLCSLAKTSAAACLGPANARRASSACRVLRAALERVDFPAGREKFLFQRDHLGALARGQLTLLVG